MKASTSKDGNLGYSVGANYFGLFVCMASHDYRIRLYVSRASRLCFVIQAGELEHTIQSCNYWKLFR